MGRKYRGGVVAGEGGSGKVLLVEREEGAGTDARKVYNAPATSDSDLVKELVTLSRLPGHPNVAGLRGVAPHGREVALVQEGIEGSPLSAVIRAGGLSIDLSVFVIREILAGLAECVHAAGLVHGDISPANVMIGCDGSVKLIDFGLARSIGSHPSDVRCTLRYASPEQLGAGDLDEGSDLFSVGAVLYTLLTGCTIFEGPDGEVHSSLLRSTPIRSAKELARIPDDVCVVLDRLLSKERTARYANAAAVLDALPVPPVTREDLQARVALLLPHAGRQRPGPARYRFAALSGLLVLLALTGYLRADKLLLPSCHPLPMDSDLTSDAVAMTPPDPAEADALLTGIAARLSIPRLTSVPPAPAPRKRGPRYRHFGIPGYKFYGELPKPCLVEHRINGYELLRCNVEPEPVRKSFGPDTKFQLPTRPEQPKRRQPPVGDGTSFSG